MTDPTIDPRSGRDPLDPAAGAAHDPYGRATYARTEHDLMSRTSWGAIFAGAVIAIAFTILLDLLGMGIGFLAVNPLNEGFGIVSVIYIIIASILALIAGGVVAGRLSGAPTLATAAAHGAAVWAVTTIVTLVLSVYAAGVIASGAASALSSASSAIARAGEAVVPEDMNWPEFRLPDITMEALPPEVRQALEEQGLTPDDLRREARAIADEVVTQQERDRIRSELISAAQEAIRNPAQADEVIESTLQDLVGPGGVITEEDMQEARAQMERRFGITPEQSEQIVARWAEQLQQATESAEQALRNARQDVEQAVDEASDALATAAWIAFFASLFGFGGAVAGAAAGRSGGALLRRR